MWDNMRLWGKYEAVESMRLWEMYRVNSSLLDIEFSELFSTSLYFLGPEIPSYSYICDLYKHILKKMHVKL